MKTIKIYPSLINADLLNLADQIELLEPHCDGFHLDVMDGHFVPAITWGHGFINAIAAKTEKQVWVHAMISDIDPFLEKLDLPPNSLVSFHPESSSDLRETIYNILQKRWMPSIALSPNSHLKALSPLMGIINHFLLMSVNPGASGQPFLENSFRRLKELDEMRRYHGRSFTIAVDGGVNNSNIKDLVMLGADHFAAANAIFGTNDPVKALATLYNAAR